MKASGRGVPYPASEKTAQGVSRVLDGSGHIGCLGSRVGNCPWQVRGVQQVVAQRGVRGGTRRQHGGIGLRDEDLPVGTAYAVWVGIGAVLTVVYAMATGEESASLLKAAFLVMIIGGVVGLKLAH